MHFSTGEYEEALKWHHKVLAARERVLGKEDPAVASMYINIGAVLDAQGKQRKALAWFQKGLEARQRPLGADHPDTAVARDWIEHVSQSQPTR